MWNCIILFGTWSKKPRLPISPQKPRQETATTLVIPEAQTSDSTELSGNMTASEGVRLLWEGDLRSVKVAADLRAVVVAIRRVRNRGIGEKKQEEESTRTREEMLLVATIFSAKTIFFFNNCFRFFILFFDIILVLLLCYLLLGYFLSSICSFNVLFFGKFGKRN